MCRIVNCFDGSAAFSLKRYDNCSESLLLLAATNKLLTVCNKHFATNVYYNCQKTCQLQLKKPVYTNAELSVRERVMERRTPVEIQHSTTKCYVLLTLLIAVDAHL
jgi:hypothetical protein